MILVQSSSDKHWMKTIETFLNILLSMEKTMFLVSMTIVYFYMEMLLVQRDTKTDVKSSHRLATTSTHLLKAVRAIRSPATQKIIVDTFFDRIAVLPNFIQINQDECAEIFAHFLAFKVTNVNLRAMERIHQFCDGSHADRMRRLCADDRVLIELETIITKIKCVRAQKMALELACKIQMYAKSFHIKESIYFNFIYLL